MCTGWAQGREGEQWKYDNWEEEAERWAQGREGEQWKYKDWGAEAERWAQRRWEHDGWEE